MTAVATLDQIRADFELLEDWEDRYRYLIELGRTLPEIAESERNEANKVRGCASQVWLVSDVIPDATGTPRIHLRGDSDAHIVRGLIAVLLAILSGRSAEEILATDTRAIFAELGLNEHLTPQRSNGLASMVARVRRDAEQAMAA
jgi:cysteine desulfuration protein SufE